MDTLLVLVHHNGEWHERLNYVNFQVIGIVLPVDCKFSGLLDMLTDQLKINREECSLHIKFQVKNGIPPLKIEDDSSLLFYIELKKTEPEVTTYPMCITKEIRQKQIILLPASSSTLQQEERTKEVLSSSGTISVPSVSGSVSGSSSASEDTRKFISDLVEFANNLSKSVVEENSKKLEILESRRKDRMVISNKRHKEVEVGQIYKNKETLVAVLSLYAITRQFRFKVAKSCPKQYYLKCFDGSCNWKLRASMKNKSKMFVIRQLQNTHICSSDVRLKHQQANPKLVEDFIKSKFETTGKTFSPADIVKAMKDDLGISISYHQAWRWRMKSLESMNGKLEESYAFLPRYLFMLKTANPGSFVELETREDSIFRYVFIALSASIKGWSYCVPFIYVDRTSLNSRCRGTLLSAATQDAAGKVFPLAFSIVNSENDESLEWFFSKLREAFGAREGLCFFSDGLESIQIAIRKIFPEVTHGVCVLHLLNNLKEAFKTKGHKLDELFIAAAKAYTAKELEFRMKDLDRVDERFRPYLESVGYQRWARAHSSGNKYTAMAFDVAESMREINKAAKNLPITALLEYLRGLIQEWSCTNRNLAKKTSSMLTKKYEDMLNDNCIHSEHLKVRQSNPRTQLFTVIGIGRSYTINMAAKTCTCNRFQMDQLPCPHVLAVLKETKQECYQHCSPFYTKEAMLATYEATVNSISNQDSWNIPSDVEETFLFPPNARLKVGRPRKC